MLFQKCKFKLTNILNIRNNFISKGKCYYEIHIN